jgi:uncharacterized repeat protein (TIGR04076 family)
MTKLYDVEVTVKSVTKNSCPQGQKVGDKWFIKGGKTPGGMCVSACNAVAPDIWLFSLGGEHPWDKDKDITEVVCPDPNVGLVFEVRRVR